MIPRRCKPAAELVVEILSPSDTWRVLSDKLADYRRVGVQERLVVSPGQQTVEVLRLTAEDEESTGVYGLDELAQSALYPDLAVSVAEGFRAVTGASMIEEKQWQYWKWPLRRRTTRF